MSEPTSGDEWTVETIGRELRERLVADLPISPTALPTQMVRAMRKQFGSLELAYEYYGFASDDVTPSFDDRTATDLIVELKAWKVRHGRCRVNEIIAERPGLVARIQRVFGDFDLALARANLNPYEEAGLAVLGATYWFNPTDIVLAFLNHGVGVSADGPTVPVLTWDRGGQPGLRDVTFHFDGFAGWLERHAATEAPSWGGLYHPYNVARVANLVFLYGVLPLREEVPGGDDAEVRFTERDLVARVPRSVLRDRRLVAHHPAIVRVSLEALPWCPRTLEFQDDFAAVGLRPIDSLTQTTVLAPEGSCISPSDASSDVTYQLTLNATLFRGVDWPKELDPYGVKCSARQVGYDELLPSTSVSLRDEGRQLLSLCLNLVKGGPDRREHREYADLDLSFCDRLLWDVPAHGPAAIRSRLGLELQAVRNVWPRLRGWEFPNVRSDDSEDTAPRVRLLFGGNL